MQFDKYVLKMCDNPNSNPLLATVCVREKFSGGCTGPNRGHLGFRALQQRL